MKCVVTAGHRWSVDVPRLPFISDFPVRVGCDSARARARSPVRRRFDTWSGSFPQCRVSQKAFQHLEPHEAFVRFLPEGTDDANASPLSWLERCRQLLVVSSVTALLSCCVSFAAPVLGSAHATPIPEGVVVVRHPFERDADVKRGSMSANLQGVGTVVVALHSRNRSRCMAFSC